MDRSQEIIRTSWIGIIANVLLAGFKAAVGILASSVAIVMDAVNNLSDALSSVITIVGTKLSQRPADRKHPFGFGRIEYFSAIIIAVIVLSAGITSLIESVKKIFNPTEPEYTTVGDAIMDLVGKENQVPNHVPLMHKPIVAARYGYVKEGSKLNVADLPPELAVATRKDAKTGIVSNYSHVYKRLESEYCA